MTVDRGSWIARLATEAVVIFASIVLALVADDWREGRAERAEETRALALIVRDLEDDARGLRTYRDRLADEEEAAARFLTLVGAGAEPDSLTRTIQGALLTYTHRPTYPSYQGLTQSGRLGLIRDSGLRDHIIGYHDARLGYLEDLQRNVETLSDRSVERLQRHLARVPAGGGTWAFRLTSDPQVLAADPEAMSALGYSAAARRWLRLRIDEVFLPENEALREAVEAYLEG